MKFIRKIWARALISFILGSFCAEFIHLSLGELDPQVSTTITWISALLIFSFFSLIVWWEKYRHYYFPKKKKSSNILDDFD